MEYKMDLDPLTQSTLTIRLFRNVKNTPEFKKRVQGGSVKCSIIRPCLIMDPFMIVLAANKALTAQKMITRNVYTEILYNLSISKNITPSLRLFGTDVRDTDILVVSVNKIGENGGVVDGIEGEEVSVEVLKDLVNVMAVRKAYKLKEDEIKGDLIGAVCNKICIKDFA